MNLIFSNTQFSEAFVDMTTTLDFNIQNYIAELLAPDTSKASEGDLSKTKKLNRTSKNPDWHQLEVIAV